MQSFSLTPEQVTNVVAQLPPSAVQAGSGLAYVDGHLLVPAEIAGLVAAADPDLVTMPVPAAVTPLQMRRALRLAGLKEAADAYLATLDEETQEAWEYATVIERSHPFIVAAGPALELSPADIDDLFRLAAQQQA